MGLVLIRRAVGYAGSGGRNTTATVLVGCAIDHGGVRHIKAVGTVMVGCAIGYAGGRRGRNAVESVMKSHTAGYGRTEAMKTVRAVVGCRTIGYTCGRVGRNPVETVAVNIQIPDQIIAAIKSMTVLDLADLVKTLESEFGVSAAPVAVAAAAPTAAPGGQAAAPAAEEKTEFTITLKSFGEKKIEVIKAVREVTTLGLKQAKDLVEAAPQVVKEAVPKEEADTIKQKLEAAGATVEIK